MHRQPASLSRMLLAQTGTELRLALRRGESVLVTLILPALVLVFLATAASAVGLARVGVGAAGSMAGGPGGVGTAGSAAGGPGGAAVDTFLPAVLAQAVMSSALVSLGIATAFERQYGVLKRLGATPLPPALLIAAKALVVMLVEAVEVALLLGIALALGWHPTGRGPAGALLGAAALALGTIAFTGLGLWIGGSWRAELALAGANLLYLVLLLLGGVFVPAAALPGPLGRAAALLPSAALADALRAALAPGPVGPGGLPALAVLGVWAMLAPALAAATFRWE